MVLVEVKKLSQPALRRWRRGDKVTLSHSPDSSHKLEVSNLEKELLVKRKGKGLRLSNSFMDRYMDRHPPALPMEPKYLKDDDDIVEGGRTYAQRLAARTRRIGERAKRDLAPVGEFFKKEGPGIIKDVIKTAAVEGTKLAIKTMAGGEVKRRGRPKKGGALIASGASVEKSTIKRRLKM